jgi:hypothetical protein
MRCLLDVVGACYAQDRDHYAVVVRGAAREWLVFLDTGACIVHKQSPLAPGLRTQALAINYLTRDPYVIAYNGNATGNPLQVVHVHMTGLVDEVVGSWPDAAAPHFQAALVDNGAQLLFVGLQTRDGAAMLGRVDLTAHTLSTRPLAHPLLALAPAFPEAGPTPGW